MLQEKRSIWSRIEKSMDADSSLEALKEEYLDFVSLYGIKGKEENGYCWINTQPVEVGLSDEEKIQVFVRAALVEIGQPFVKCLEVRAKETTGGNPDGKMLYATDGVTTWGPSGDVLYDPYAQKTVNVLLGLLNRMRKDIMPRQLAIYRNKPLEWDKCPIWKRYSN